MSSSTLARGPTLQVDGHDVRLLALECDAGAAEAYVVAVGSVGCEQEGRLRHVGAGDWELIAGERRSQERLGTPDAMFAKALGASSRFFSPTMTPHWPVAVTERLMRRGLVGAGVIAFDVEWFLTALTSSAMDLPMLLPDGASKLALDELQGASALLLRRAEERLVPVLLQALGADGADWDGEGRLIGEFPTGELAQLGHDIDEGCRAAVGTGLLRVAFEPGEPLGLGLGPTERGAWVGEVDANGVAECAGVTVGMVVAGLSGSKLCPEDLDGVLDAIDQQIDAGEPLVIVFDTSSVANHLYAVEMAAAPTLAALGGLGSLDTGAALKALCGAALLWHESTPRLFFGEAGSLTSAHTDICPQLQLAQGLLGNKLLGVTTHAATRRLVASHGGDDDPAHVPTDRPMTAREARLLRDPAVSLVHLQAGDLAVFDSGALHFASHGSEGLQGAVYQGIMTPGAVPRLRRAASAGRHRDAAYQDHLGAMDLLHIVEGPLAAYEASLEAAANRTTDSPG